MKISAVNSITYTPKVKQNLRNGEQNPVSSTPQCDTVSFGKVRIRWGGAAGGVLGTLAGIGLATLTGGVAAPFLLPLIGGGVGAIGGDMVDHEIRPNNDEEDDIDRWSSGQDLPNNRDY